jgi:GNAT superfamily N-acetyltransferase
VRTGATHEPGDPLPERARGVQHGADEHAEADEQPGLGLDLAAGRDGVERAGEPHAGGEADDHPSARTPCRDGGVSIRVLPATAERFDDVAAVLGPRNPAASVCWCLSHRVDARTNRSLVGPARGEHVRRLCSRDVAPGVLAYDGDRVVGWAAVAPRSELPFARSTRIPHVDDLPVWSLWCIRVRPGHRGRGLSLPLVEGATAYAFACGAPAVEGYPVDNAGAAVDLTMAYVGTRAVFERAGFVKAADTASVSGGFPRVLVRRPRPGDA